MGIRAFCVTKSKYTALIVVLVVRYHSPYPKSTKSNLNQAALGPWAFVGILSLVV